MVLLVTVDLERSDRCRLCSGSTTTAFQKMVMHKYTVKYFECDLCGSLQTEFPYWLDEAYSDARRFTDTYGGVRAVRNQVYVHYLYRILGLSSAEKVVDYGGGDGLTARVLRDIGLDAYSYDRYARNLYAIGFDGNLQAGLAMITSFEVWEHLAHPARELGELFAHKPKSVVISTGIYRRQGEKWPYLGAYSGRHVFFYSPSGINWIAETYRYDYVIEGGYVVFSALRLKPMQRRAIRILLGGRAFRFLHAWMAFHPPKGRSTEDWTKMRSMVKDDT
jgi:Methyltransferase domain